MIQFPSFFISSSGKKMEHQDQSTTTSSTTMTVEQRRWIVGGRERTRSESGKENSAATANRPPANQMRQRRSDRFSLRERSGSEASAVALALAALSANEPETSSSSSQLPSADSPVDLSITDSVLPSDSDQGNWGDQHSSEEELECINGPEHSESVGPSMPVVGAAVDGESSDNTATAAALRFGPSAFGPPAALVRRGQTPHHHHHHQQQVCSFNRLQFIHFSTSSSSIRV